MHSSEIRKKFLDFFAKNGHTVVPSSSLIPDDPSVLLTTAGMQQFKPYYSELDPTTTIHPLIGKPLGKNAASCQKSFRTSDIDEVGDERHLTFFEMLGNFSFGGYFKKEAISFAHEFITSVMKLPISYVTIFKGKPEIGVPKDEESRVIWQSLGVSDIREEGMDDVFWGPTGGSGPCGPTTEIYCKNAARQDIEVWNIVFNQYFYSGSREELNQGAPGKKLSPLKTPGVDTGMGLERLAMIAQKTKTIFETDLLAFLIETLPTTMTMRTKRIIADHLRAGCFLISDGVRPSNKGAGYVLRRLLRRVIVHLYLTNDPTVSLDPLIEEVAAVYGPVYPELKTETLLAVFSEEQHKFLKTLKSGLKELEKVPAIDAATAFKIFESFGLPFEIIKEIGADRAQQLTREGFEQEFKKHQEISRAGATAKFGGHGLYLKTGEVTIRDASEVEKVTRLHTATHLMHAALRAVLGPEVRQDGSDITAERTRFDFRFDRKVTADELKKAEAWVNEAIKKDLTVKWEEVSYDEGVKTGALGFFKAKYPPRVKVYTVFNVTTGEVYSKEFCGGPHVEHTGMIGTFKIQKEEAVGAGVRRVRATID